jgi:bifunctional UDP-N-acetylglucosamine pyrophosphorylase/glucosamine-1-phosphate N-acetyltransferase
VVGKGAFVGSNSALVAPVKIGDAAYVGSGSVITDNVPSGALALGRGRQVVKPDWAARQQAGAAKAPAKSAAAEKAGPAGRAAKKKSKTKR